MTPRTDRTTVVVISHNYGRFLRQAVQSVLDQTLRPHVLIADDASTDGTPELARSLVREAGGGVEYRRATENLGLARTRNRAASDARTPWIVYLDADDWLAREFIARGERWLDAHPRVDVLTTDMSLVREGRRPARRNARAPRRWTDLLRANSIVQTSFIRRSLVLDLGGYDPTLDFEDWDFWLRATKAGARVQRLPGAHVFRREHGANKSKRCDERAATAAVLARHRVPA